MRSKKIWLNYLGSNLGVPVTKTGGPKGGSSIIPIAFPLIAGPGSFTTLLALRAEYDAEWIKRSMLTIRIRSC